MGLEPPASPAGAQRGVVAPLRLASGIDDLPRMRVMTAQWAGRAGLPPERMRLPGSVIAS